MRTERTYWTPEEDQRLVEQVEQHGTNKWVVIASSFEGKDNKSCSHRYNNYLDPLLNKSPFSPWEDGIVTQLYKEVGPRWKYIAKCLSGSQGRRSANTVKNRYQALKKFWVPSGEAGQPSTQEPAASEEEDPHEAENDSQVAVRPDAAGAALINSQQPPQQLPQPPQFPELVVPAEGQVEMGSFMQGMMMAQAPLIMPADKPQEPKPSQTTLKENALTADGPLYHMFMTLQSKLHKTSQIISRDNLQAQAWEQDKQKIHGHLDSIRSILDSRVLAINAAAQQAAAPPAPPPEERPAAATPQPAPESSPKPQQAEKEPDAKSDHSNVSASSGAGKRTAETLKKKKGKELNPMSSEMDVACILNDLANVRGEERATNSAEPSGRPQRKRTKATESP